MSFFGYHLRVLAQNVWTEMSASPTQWRAALAADMIPAATADAWLTAINATNSNTGVRFLEKLSQDMPQGIAVVTEDGMETVTGRGMSDSGGYAEDGTSMSTMAMAQNAVLWVISSDEVLGRAVVTALRSRLIAAFGYLCGQGGYDGISYAGGDPPTYDERLTRQWMNVYVYGLTFQARVTVRIPDYSFTTPSVPATSLVILASDTTNDDDIPGGVRAVPVEE